MADQWSAVGRKSRIPVANSGRVLRRPTPPDTADRKSETDPLEPHRRESPSQPQSWPGARDLEGPAANPSEPEGASELPLGKSAGREAPALDAQSIPAEDLSVLIRFFQTLDCWDREARHGS